MDYSNKTKYLIVFLLICIIAMVGFSYSYFQNFKENDAVDAFNTSCFDIEYTSLSDAINIENAYPISDTEGQLTNPYTFKVTNKCPYDMNLNIKLNVVKNTTLDSKYVKVSLGKDVILTPTNLATLEQKNFNNEEYLDSRLLKTTSLDQYQSIEVDLRMWVDGSTKDGEGNDSTIKAKIEVEGFNK